MFVNFGDVVAAYMLPVVLGIVLIVAILVVLSFVSRLGNERRDDPAGRALHERRKRD